MKAGQVGAIRTSSVRPLDVDGNDIGDIPDLEVEEDDDVDIPVEFGTEVADRIGAEKEGQYVRMLVDPKLPTKEEVDMRNLMRHVEYRNWCDIDELTHCRRPSSSG